MIFVVAEILSIFQYFVRYLPLRASGVKWSKYIDIVLGFNVHTFLTHFGYDVNVR